MDGAVLSYYPRPTTTFGASFARPNASPSATTLRVPNGYDSRKRYPLVIVLHSYGATGVDVATRLDLDDAPQFGDGCLLLAPDGQISPASAPNQFWDYWEIGATTSDFLYIQTLIAEVMAVWPVDASRIYIVGYSNGAFMAHQLSQQLPVLFTAGFTLAGCAGTNDSTVAALVATPWVHYHGDNDTTVLYAGDPAAGLPGVLDTHGGVGSPGYKSALNTTAEHNLRNGSNGALQAAYDVIDFVSTPAGNETSRQAYSHTTPETAVEHWKGAAGTHTVSLSFGNGQLVFQWLQDHHRIVVTPVSIAVTPAALTIGIGASTQFTAVATLSDGSTTDVTATATWTSNASAASVSPSGLALGLAAGSAQITATLSAIVGSAALVVGNATPLPAGAVRLTDLINIVRLRGDYLSSLTFKADYITHEIQAAWAELYEIIADTHEAYFDKSTIVATVASQPYIGLPTDCWRIQGVDIDFGGGDWHALRQLGMKERNRYGTSTARPEGFRLSVRGLELFNTPDGIYQIRVSYTPIVTTLDNTGIQLFGWEEYIITGALLRLDQREERPTGERQAELERCKRRVIEAASQRKSVEPEYLIGGGGGYDEDYL